MFQHPRLFSRTIEICNILSTISAIIVFSSFLRPVPGPFPLLLHLPNGQTMPVAIPASITNSNVHVPTAVPVSLLYYVIPSFKIWTSPSHKILILGTSVSLAKPIRMMGEEYIIRLY